jgi:arylformamidase
VEYIDLSHTVVDGMLTYPGLPPPAITDHLTFEDSRERYDEGTEFRIGRVEMVANTGTYLDTPAHRFREGLDLEGLPLRDVVDVPGVCVPAAGPAIGPDVLDGHDLEDRAVLFATGWDRAWGTEGYGSSGHPHLNAETVEALITADVALVGIDSVNIDDTSGGSRPAHTGLLGAGIPIVEHLTGLDRLIDREFRFTAVPVKVRGLGSFPVRAFAAVRG